MNIFDYICETLCIEPSQMESFSATAPYRYKIYDIPKRSGRGTRTIAHPSRPLKFIQRLVISQLDLLVTPHTAAMAYVKGRGIKDNAEAHVNNDYLLKMDLKDFFPSITPELFFEECIQHGIIFDSRDKKLLSNILFFKSSKQSKLKLSIGAPSSPLVSNIVMSRFDSIVYDYCRAKKITYTRYADDLTFSTKKKSILFDIPLYIRKTLRGKGYELLSVNKEKTIFSSKKHNRHVTGITLTNDSRMSIGREQKRILSACVHKLSVGDFDKANIDKLRGELSFAFYIEPQFKVAILNKYGADVYDKIFKKKES